MTCTCVHACVWLCLHMQVQRDGVVHACVHSCTCVGGFSCTEVCRGTGWHTYVHARGGVCMHVQGCACKCVHAYGCVCARRCLNMDVSFCTRVCASRRVCSWMSARIFLHICARICPWECAGVQIHVRVHTRRRTSSASEPRGPAGGTWL